MTPSGIKPATFHLYRSASTNCATTCLPSISSTHNNSHIFSVIAYIHTSDFQTFLSTTQNCKPHWPGHPKSTTINLAQYYKNIEHEMYTKLLQCVKFCLRLNEVSLLNNKGTSLDYFKTLRFIGSLQRHHPGF